MNVSNRVAAHPSDRPSGRVEQTMNVSAGQRIGGGRSAPESMGPSAAHSSDPERAVGLGGAHAGTGRTSRRRLQVIHNALSERDWALLTTLDQHGYLTTLQLQRMHFADHATSDAAGRVCRRVLQRLAEHRVIEHLERRVGGIRAGSASYVWRVGPIGDRLLTQSAAGPRARRKEPSLHHLDHRLAVAETHIRLLEASRDHRWELLRVQLEPASWRPFLTIGGARSVLKPDLYAVTAVGDFEDHWFIEVDRGTESLPTLLRKCAQYEAYRATGAEQRDHGVFPLVLWLLPDDRRAEQLRTAIRQARGLDEQLYRLTTSTGLIAAVTGAAA